MIHAAIDLATAGLIVGAWFAAALIFGIAFGRLCRVNDVLAYGKERERMPRASR